MGWYFVPHQKRSRRKDDTLFKGYTHPECTLQQMKIKAWPKESSFTYAALKKIVAVLNEIKHLTDFNHTSTL